MSWKLRWGWDRHGTNTQPAAHKETRKEGEDRGCGCGCGWGGDVGERLHQEPTALDCQLVDRWRRGESESPMSLLSWGNSYTACCGPEGGGARPVAWGSRGGTHRWPAPATEIVALLPYTTPWEMLLRSVESGVVDGTGCGGGKRWCCYNTRRVGRAMGTATHPCKALDSPQA